MPQFFWEKYIHRCQPIGQTAPLFPNALTEELKPGSLADFYSNLSLQPHQIMAISVLNLESILQNFVNQNGEIQGATLVSPDGLSLASTLPPNMDDERVAAMSAAMLSLGERIGQELARGAIERLYVEGEKGIAVLVDCGSDALLLVLASQAIRQGLLMLEIKRIVTELKAVLA